jgi:hypothetical protein
MWQFVKKKKKKTGGKYMTAGQLRGGLAQSINDISWIYIMILS